MKRGAPLTLALLVLACSRAEREAAPVYELTDVARAKLAELETRVGPLPPEVTPDAEQRSIAVGSVSVLAGGASDFRSVALDDLRGVGPAAVPVLREILLDAARPAEERAAAAEGLGALDDPTADEVLMQALEKASEPWVRAQAVWRLASSRHDHLLPRLILRLKYEKDAEAVIWLAATLARMGSFAGLDGLCVLRDGAPSEELRATSAARLAEIVERTGAADSEELVRDWKSGALEARLPAAEPSERLRCEAWRLIAGLSEWNLRGVDESRFVLSHLGAWVAVPLAAALHDADVYTRVHAAQCLERMGPRARAAGPELVLALAEPRTAPAAAAALGAIGFEPAGPDLEAMLAGSADLELRVAAARALEKFPSASALDLLERVFHADGPADLRQAAAESLAGSERGTLVVPFLVGCLTSPLADPGGAEAALERWISRSEADPELAARWRVLAAPLDRIETADEAAHRRAARAELLRAAPAGAGM